ncbi:unnamed protein product [Blepharisma stoltei]|uniref:Uncharacterized protein n=1 Tax=Blepharisma stoltei TaxID=1481888 RepID=A0AAU9JIL6_9CILI|nr:unnamed protein product [Blepharisma stoltei]
MSIYGELQLEYKDLLTLSKIKERREQKIENLKRKIVRLAEEKSHTQAKIANYEAISKDFLQVVEKGNISQDDKNRIMSQIQRTMMINENGKLKTPKVLNIPKSFGSANEELWNLYVRFQNYFNNIKSH